MLLQDRGARPAASTANLTAPWQPLGPATVTSVSYGPVSGRISSISLDPNDTTGNTVWLGTTGGGVWKSTNAAGALASVSFAPLTDTLPVFSANEGASTVPSLSIGAVAVQPASTAVVLAGTGDPNDATDSYYGEGILRSADGGQTWTLAVGSRDGANGTHTFAGLATAGIAWSSATPTLVAAAMTTSLQGLFVDAAGASAVPGLYFSTDAGVTWQMASVYDGTQLVQTPVPPGIAQAANNATAVVWDAQRGLFVAALSAHGYYGSADGQTWKRLANQPGLGLTTANCPVGANGAGSANCPMLRGALAVQPATGDLYALTVDANEADQGLWQDLCNAGSNGQCATASPTFATRIDHGALEVGQGTVGSSTTIVQGSYDLALAAGPAANNGTVLFAGTMDLYRCSLALNGSTCTLRNTTNASNGCNAPAMVAPAQHALAALAQSSGAPLLLLGNDGGLWRSPDGVDETGSACAATDVDHFDNLNPAIGVGGSLAEVVGFAQDPALPDTLLAGMGANGSAATTTAGALKSWPQMSAGEGGYPQLDPATTTNWYLTVGAGVNLDLCAVGQACAATDFLSVPTVGEPQVAEDAALLDAPTLLDPQNTANLLVGTCRVWRGPAQSSSGWRAANALSPALDGDTTPCTLSSSFVRSLGAGGPVASGAAEANSGSEVVYAGMAGALDGGGTVPGHVFVTAAGNTANGSTVWTDAANGAVLNGSATFNVAGFDISSVTADSHDATGGTVYATVMGFGSGEDIPHVYRSSDFGAHWTDVSANLPDAPANGLVVDPNDANTVYVALDTGVYVTQGISTCATANCWSPLGAGLPNAPVTELLAGANLPTGDGRYGSLRAGTYGRGLWETPLLTAHSILQPKLVASPATLSFGSQAEGTESSAQTVSLTSDGNSPITISSIALTGDFVETDTCSGQTFAVGATCTVSVQFAPTAMGARTGLMTVYADVAGGQVTISLAGTGSAPAAIVLTPLSLQFPSTVVNQTAGSQIITVSNTGANPATLSAETVTGDFAISQNTCGASLPSQTGCSIAIQFKPTASGTRTGVLTVADSVGTQTAQLSGVGQAPATDTLSPLSLTFAQQQVGSTSAAQQITLTNAGDVALTLIAASVTSGDFTATNACGSSLAPHSSCAVSVTFVPKAVGNETGVLTISDQVRVQTVPLSGTGYAPAGVSLTPILLTFANTGVGLNAAAQTVQLTNNGGQPLAISSASITGDFVVATTCGSVVAVGGVCNLAVSFAPTAAGPRTGTLTLTDSASGGKQIVNLSGTGVDFTLAANGATSVNLASGGNATFPLVLSSIAGLSGNVALTCSGAPANSVCTVSPQTAALGGNVQVSVVVQTGMSSASARVTSPGLRGRRNGILFAFAPVVLLGLRLRRVRGRMDLFWDLRSLGLLVLCFASVAGVAGCGASREIPFSGTGGGSGNGNGYALTPSGTYQVTVSGSSTGVTHTVPLTLTVN